jgi:hypothetical protein
VTVSPSWDTGRAAAVEWSRVDAVETRQDVVAIVEAMLADLQAAPDDWENGTVQRYLEALAATLNALDRLYANRGEPIPATATWRQVAQALVMASGYE